jgi:K+-sensing histidine kinase KdpD
MLRVITHDISNALTLLSISTKIITRRKNLSEEKEKYHQEVIERSIKSIKHCVGMCNKSLDINSKIINSIPVSTSEVIHNCIKLHSELVAAKEIKLEVDAQDLTILGDLQNLSLSVFGNYLTNAIKFSHRSSTIKVGSYAKNESEVAIYIKDSGVGMCPNQVESILRSGGDSTNGTESENGHGLGTVIANNFLEKYNARLEVESCTEADSSGTIVTAIFPKLK